MRFSSQTASLAACFCPLYSASHVICSASMELSTLFVEREDVVREVKVDPEGSLFFLPKERENEKPPSFVMALRFRTEESVRRASMYLRTLRHSWYGKRRSVIKDQQGLINSTDHRAWGSKRLQRSGCKHFLQVDGEGMYILSYKYVQKARPLPLHRMRIIRQREQHLLGHIRGGGKHGI